MTSQECHVKSDKSRVTAPVTGQEEEDEDVEEPNFPLSQENFCSHGETRQL